MWIIDALRAVWGKSSSWEQHDLLFGEVMSIDGQKLRGEVMRRWVNGAWQYRAVTPEDEEENLASRAW